MAGARFVLRGTQEMHGEVALRIKQMHARIDSAIMAEFRIELREVIERTPIKTGALRRTEHINGPEWNWNKVRVEIVAGGDGVDYAAVVHNDLLALHPIGQALYLESVLMESAPFMARRIAKRLNFSEAVEWSSEALVPGSIVS